MLHEILWRANRDLAQACFELPFVQGLASGGLAAAAFQRYVAQDAFFLRAFFARLRPGGGEMRAARAGGAVSRLDGWGAWRS